jgi:hypothetical protein
MSRLPTFGRLHLSKAGVQPVLFAPDETRTVAAFLATYD